MLRCWHILTIRTITALGHWQSRTFHSGGSFVFIQTLSPRIHAEIILLLPGPSKITFTFVLLRPVYGYTHVNSNDIVIEKVNQNKITSWFSPLFSPSKSLSMQISGNHCTKCCTLSIENSLVTTKTYQRMSRREYITSAVLFFFWFVLSVNSCTKSTDHCL